MHSYKGGSKPFNVYARTRFVCECVYIKSMSTDFGKEGSKHKTDEVV